MDNMMKLADFILAEAKSLGADYCQCTVSEREKREFNVDGGRFSLMRTLFDRGVNVTVLKGQRKGTVQINRFDEDAIKTAVNDAIAAVAAGVNIKLPNMSSCLVDYDSVKNYRRQSQ